MCAADWLGRRVAEEGPAWEAVQVPAREGEPPFPEPDYWPHEVEGYAREYLKATVELLPAQQCMQVHWRFFQSLALCMLAFWRSDEQTDRQGRLLLLFSGESMSALSNPASPLMGAGGPSMESGGCTRTCMCSSCLPTGARWT